MTMSQYLQLKRKMLKDYVYYRRRGINPIPMGKILRTLKAQKRLVTNA